MITLRSSANIDFRNGIKCCLYGASGTGKTPILATAPLPLIINLEKGLISIRNLRPPVPYIDCFDSPMPPVDYLDREVIPWLISSVEARQFYTCGLDSLAEVMDVELEQQKRVNKDARKAFYATAERTKEIARKFRDIPGKACVLICKEEKGRDVTGIEKYQPMIPGVVLSNEMPYFFDEVMRVEIGNPGTKQEWRALRCHANSFAHARDRSEMLNEYEPTNLTQVFSKILGTGA